MWSFHTDGDVPDERDWVFVFGSNLAGRHGRGAAKVAVDDFGARYGAGRGHVGRSYALPTKDEKLNVLDLATIKGEVEAFICHARRAASKRHWVTRVGCGLAGYADAQIAPMFRAAPENCSFAREWRRYLVDDVPWEDTADEG
jgi:hypothetical protein